ncbi:hypothetical protein [Amnibacterium kyonggiense]|uniref:Uncharacterized protein n=1 Tax=Amnibacterium kyonggiense TaxID=595671 RepID=A0A4R7FR55_9MICO|nr:hypothetical protein [Amnibacterium kyonggiense]TDS80178.1 hypothetical protein CLV52_0732 [Amnibacterium kyonggiense]
MSIRVLQYRSDIAPDQVQLRVVNGSEERIVVRAAALRGSGWTPALRWSDDDPAEIGAGVVVDLPARLTTADCGSTTRLSGLLRLADGTTRSVRAVDEHGTLRGLHAADCFRERAARTASLAVAAFRPHGRTAEVDLAVIGGAAAAAGIEIERVLPTPLLSPAGGTELWTIGRRFTASGRLALRTVPTRCDLHAIAEDKVGTVLPVQLRLADGARGTVPVRAPKAIKDAVLAWVVRACGDD